MKETYESMRDWFEDLPIDEQVHVWNDFWYDNNHFFDRYKIWGWGDPKQNHEVIKDIARVYQLDEYDLFQMEDETYCYDNYVRYSAHNNTLWSYAQLNEWGDEYDVFIDGLVKEHNEEEEEA